MLARPAVVNATSFECLERGLAELGWIQRQNAGSAGARQASITLLTGRYRAAAE